MFGSPPYVCMQTKVCVVCETTKLVIKQNMPFNPPTNQESEYESAAQSPGLYWTHKWLILYVIPRIMSLVGIYHCFY